MTLWIRKCGKKGKNFNISRTKSALDESKSIYHIIIFEIVSFGKSIKQLWTHALLIVIGFI